MIRHKIQFRWIIIKKLSENQNTDAEVNITVRPQKLHFGDKLERNIKLLSAYYGKLIRGISLFLTWSILQRGLYIFMYDWKIHKLL